MQKYTFQFQGAPKSDLLVMILAGVVATLVLYGAWQLICRRWKRGALCIVAAVPGVVCLTRAGSLEPAMWMLAVGVQVGLAIAVFYAAVYAYLGTRRIATLMVLRCLAVLALLLILFKPAVSVIHDLDALKPELPILVDRSGSMDATDGGDTNRYSQCLRMLESQEDRIRRYFRPVYFHFAQGLQLAESLDALGKLAPKGEGTEGTNIALAVRECAHKYRTAELPGMMVFSDGIHNALTDNVMDSVIEAGVPLYTLGVGAKTENATGRRNLQLLSVDAPFEAIKNNVSTIGVEVRAVGFANVNTELQLMEEGGTAPVATLPVFTDKDVATIKCDLKWTPKDKGATSGPAKAVDKSKPPRSEVRKLRVVIPAANGESIAEDNAADIHVLVTEPRIRILLIEGSLRPEYKFLMRILSVDQNVQFMSLVQVSKNKFSANGSIGGKTLEDLPRADEDFKMFDVIIIGDIDATYFSPDQMAKLKQFVKDGGGLMMLGGLQTFGPGGYGSTDLEAVLPVTVGGRNQPQETSRFLPMLTAAGVEHPIFEGISGYFFGPDGAKPKAELHKLPDLLGCVAVVDKKPAASVLAVHPTRTNEAGPLIVLAVQQFGAGRSAAFMSDTTWQWFLELKGMGEDSPYQLFWAQMVRWLSNVQAKSKMATPSLVLRVDNPYVQLGNTLKVTARVQDEKGKTADNANVTCQLVPDKPIAADGQTETVPLTSRRTGGMFEVNVRPLREGKFTLKATAVDAVSGATLGTDELPIVAAPHSAETDLLARDEALLQQISERNDGRYADIAGLPEIVDQIIDRQRVRGGDITTKGENYHLYNFTVLFLVLVALLTTEWLLRRNWQLQ